MAMSEYVVDVRSTDSAIISIGEQQQKSVDCSAEKRKSLRARYMYGILFLMINLCAWFIRDYAQKLLPQLHYIETCGSGGHDCLQTLGVLRISLGCFMFFFLMFLSTFNTKKLDESRNKWHSGWWWSKLCLLLAFIAVSFFFPSDFIHVYGEVARVGAGIFLVLQLISVIEFIAWWNDYWMPDKEQKQSCYLGLLMSKIFYIASLFGIVLMYCLYASKLACSLNIFFISWTAVLLIVMLVISLHPMVNRGLLSSGIMAAYLVFLCWSAIRSEPAHEICNAKAHVRNGDWTTILGFLIAICAIVMATFSTGLDSQSFQFRKDKVHLDDDVPYDYGFFHLVFSLGAMYFAMLFISWDLKNTAREWSIDVGWASTWVKIINEWFAASIYLWKLISPVVRQPKIVTGEEPNRQIDDSTSS